MALALGACTGAGCVVRGTPIQTPDGPVNVEDLSLGDDVVTVAPDGTPYFGRIVGYRAVHTASYLEIFTTANTDPLHVTASHPIALATPPRWRRAADLKVGESVQAQSGTARITGVRKRSRPVVAYDITVEPFPVFLANGVRVHNKTIALHQPPSPESLVGTWIGWSNRRTCRLTLYDDGTAILGVLDSLWDGQFTAYATDEWRLRDYDLVALFQPISDAECAPLNVQGVADAGQLRLSISASGARARSPVQFLPEVSARARFATLESAMKEYERERYPSTGR